MITRMMRMKRPARVPGGEEEDITRINGNQAEYRPDESGFPGTIRADDRIEITRPDVQIYIFKNDLVLQGDLEIPDLDDRIHEITPRRYCVPKDACSGDNHGIEDLSG